MIGGFGGGGGVNFSTLVYLPAYDLFARPVTFFPYASQPGAGAFPGRGIYNTRALTVEALDGAIFSDQETILDVREAEFGVLPQQGDQLYIPAADNGPDLGRFEVQNSASNGGGETTLVIRKWAVPAP
jgi:hypothetical protein